MVVDSMNDIEMNEIRSIRSRSLNSFFNWILIDKENKIG
jgi:hypothetical protein